jgi:hypothetical protein
MPLILRRTLKGLCALLQPGPNASVSKDAPIFRRAQAVGDIAAIPLLGGLHHYDYVLVPGISFLQFVQQRPDTVEVRVICNESFDGSSDLILRRLLREALGPSMVVRIHHVPLEETYADPSGKRPVVVSEVTLVAAGSGVGADAERGQALPGICPQRGCPSSKLNPHEFIGGFDLLAIA